MSPKQNNITSPAAGPALGGRVFAMPDYYLPKGKQGGMNQKTLFIILIAVIVLLILGVFGFIFFRTQQAPEIAQQPAQQQPPATQQPAVTPEPEEEPVEEPAEEPEPEQPGISLPPIQLPSVQTAADTDQDGLTDPEEVLFSTSASVPDTDQDSYLDGAEVTNLYDPATPGALLEVSPQVKIVTNSARGYQMLVPAAWTASNAVPGGEEYLVRPPDGTELFSIAMYENPDRMTPVQWYQDQQPGADLSLFNNFQNEAGWTGIQSRDGRIVIATFGASGAGARAFIFVMVYEPGNAGIMRYPTIWKMITMSLSVVESPEEAAIQAAQQQQQAQPPAATAPAPQEPSSQTPPPVQPQNQQQEVPAGSSPQDQQSQTPQQAFPNQTAPAQ